MIATKARVNWFGKAVAYVAIAFMLLLAVFAAITVAGFMAGLVWGVFEIMFQAGREIFHF